MNLVVNQTRYGWVDQGSEFFNRSIKSRLHDHNIKIGIEGKYTVAERFIRTPKRKIYKHMNLTKRNKNVHIDKL